MVISAPDAKRTVRFLSVAFALMFTIPKQIANAAHKAGSLKFGVIHGILGRANATPDVKMVNTETADVLPGVTEGGENKQVAPAGRPDEHVNEIGFEKAPCAVAAAEIEMVVGFPCATLALPGDAASV